MLLHVINNMVWLATRQFHCVVSCPCCSGTTFKPSEQAGRCGGVFITPTTTKKIHFSTKAYPALSYLKIYNETELEQFI